MCGICGTLSLGASAPDTAVVERMNRALTHRGPDDAGLRACGPAVLAMRRLSILDLEGGAQPMADPDGRRILVYNGEIYNHPELRKTFTGEGWSFRTRSDTEVVLAALSLHGEAGLALLNGMFALALWDSAQESLLLARDGVGVKPLFVALLDDGVAWSSELRSLALHPRVSPEVDPGALARYLVHEAVPSPGSMLQGVEKLEPGTWLRVGREGTRRGTFWEPPFRRPDPVWREPGSLEEAETAFLRALEGAVRRQMVADVPVGIFLSGGLDSSALAAAAVRVAGERVRTFSVGFREESFDESPHARTVARHLGTEHQEEILDPDAAVSLVPEMGRLLDEPLGDASLLPTSLLCRFARRHVKVALSGDGGDELFGGYPTYPAHRWVRVWRALGPLGPRLLAPLVGLLPVSERNFSLEFKARRFLRGADPDNPLRHLLWMGSFAPEELSTLLQPDLAREMGDPLESARRLWAQTRLSPAGERASSGPEGGHPIERVRRFDLLTYLRDDLLAKTDRASMAHSLEVRVPLLDLEMVEWAEGLPLSYRIRGFRTKVLMRRALARRLPAEILDRPKKGFGIPLSAWLRGPLRELARDLLSPEALRREGIFRPEPVGRLLEDHLARRRDARKPLWTLLAFRLWNEGR